MTRKFQICLASSNVPTSRHHGAPKRAVRLPEGDLPVIAADGTSKSAASRRFVALSAERLAEWMMSDLSNLDLLVIQIDVLGATSDADRSSRHQWGRP